VIFKWKLGRTEYQIVLRGRYCSLGRTRRLDFGGIEVPEYTLWGFPDPKSVEVTIIDARYYFDSAPFIFKFRGKTYEHRIPPQALSVQKIRSVSLEGQAERRRFLVSLPKGQSVDAFRAEIDALKAKDADEILVNGVLHWQRPAPSSPSD
jgi:hypothetical protein